MNMENTLAVVNTGSADHNPKFYVSAPEAYAELDRRESYGIPADVLMPHEWDHDIMVAAVAALEGSK